MDERTGRLVGEISRERQRLADNVAELEHKLRDAANWRTHFAQRPWKMLGLALAGGFLLSSLLPHKSR